MPHDRFYTPASLENTVILEGQEFHHLTRVMRKQVGDTIELVNGQHMLAEGTIYSLSKWEATITISSTSTQNPQLPSLTLIQALPKLPKLEIILQKGTELGVSEFYLYPSSQSEKHTLSDNQKNRLDQIIIGAMKQCGRLDIPTLKWGFPELTTPLFFGDLRPEAPLLSEKATLPSALLIGPEKGLTNEELKKFDNQGQGVQISPYILRTETAAIAGLSLLAGSHRPE